MFGKNKKRSFIDKLTGSVHIDEYDDDYLDRDENIELHEDELDTDHLDSHRTSRSIQAESIEEEGELSVDVYESPTEIVVKAMVAGVKPADLDIDIARDTVTIYGSREYAEEVNEENYYHKELYWGSFKRKIMLPEEIDVDAAEATERHGLLVIRLPKLDKSRKTKLRVKSER